VYDTHGSSGNSNSSSDSADDGFGWGAWGVGVGIGGAVALTVLQPEIGIPLDIAEGGGAVLGGAEALGSDALSGLQSFWDLAA